MEEPMQEQEVRGRLRQWRAAHPQATFDEIDAEVQRQFAPLQAQVVVELSGEAAAGAADPAAEVRCPQCGAAMQRRGRRPRQVPTRQGAWVSLRRAYYVCPACGAGHFPPRCGAGAAGQQPL